MTPALRPRPGFTLIEVIVVLTLLVSGALAAVAATALAVRTVGAAELQLRATAAARNRLEALAVRGCSEITSDSALDPTLVLREWWAAMQSRNGVRLLTDSVVYIDRGNAHVVVRHRLVVC